MPSWHRYWMNHCAAALLASVVVGLFGWLIGQPFLWSFGAGCIGAGLWYTIREIAQCINGQPVWPEAVVGAGAPILALAGAYGVLWGFAG